MIIELEDYSVLDALQHRFSEDSPQVVVIPTNQEGIFGAGIAKFIRAGVPELEFVVREAAKNVPGLLKPSRLQTALTNDPLISIALVPTKVKPSDDKSTMTSIVQGLNMLFSSVEYGSTIMMPKIGTGHGGLTWESKSCEGVRSIVEKLAKRHDVTVIVPCKFVYPDDVKPLFGGRREVYDFCVHGHGHGDNYKPLYYAMTYAGMQQMVDSNPIRFPQEANPGENSGWVVLSGLGYTEPNTQFQLNNDLFKNFTEHRNAFGMSEYYWREAFDGFIKGPSKRTRYVVMNDEDDAAMDQPKDQVRAVDV